MVHFHPKSTYIPGANENTLPCLSPTQAPPSHAAPPPQLPPPTYPPRTSACTQNTAEVNPWLDPSLQVQPGLLLRTAINMAEAHREEIPSSDDGRKFFLSYHLKVKCDTY